MLRQFQINHLFNGSFATLCKQAGQKKLKFKLVNYSVYYPVLQDCACKTSKNLALILHLYAQKMSFLANLALFLQGYLTPARLLQDLARARKVDVNVHFLARILQLAGYVTFPSLTRLLLLVPKSITEQKEPQILCRSKVINI